MEKHFCLQCGSSKSQRAYWKYIVYGDPELQDVPKSKKNLLVDFILYQMAK